MLKTGMTIAERYEILGKIGTGGMADVYKAKDHKLNRFVAVKVLKPEFREDTTFIRKFRSEAQAAAGLTHPNIVNVFDVGDDEGVYYIVMELIEGITLKEYIAKKGKLSIKEATSIAIQVSMGLEAAHNHGIVHRDVKPQNIIISTDGKVKVTDFGIARAASSNTISSNVMGSVHYSSPEQVRGGYSDEKSDIYSLGITLYEMVTGRVPFDGDTTVAIAIKHLQEEMVPPSVYTEELPYSLEQIILKCTQKSVNRRYEKMEDVIADLKHSLIDPQGNFVKLSSVDNEAKTVVISDEELGEIKHTPKNRGTQQYAPEVADLEEEVYDDDYEDSDYGYEDYEDDDDRRHEERRSRSKNKKHKSSGGSAVTILALLAGAVVLVVAIFFIGKAAGIIGSEEQTDTQKEQTQSTDTAADENGMVTVPNLVGKTEEEASALLEEEKLGKQMVGEEDSTQEKGRISSQDIPAGTKVEQYTTLKYYISKGQQTVTMPDVTGETGVDAQQTLEDLGLTVTVQKEYSEDDGTGYPLVNPGYVDSVTPEAGSSVSSGDEVTLVVSRGLDYGNSVYVPSVVGMTKNDAITTLGKWLDIQVTEEQSTEVAAGEVISQSPEADEAADPDQPITIVVSSGDQAPSTEDTSSEDVSAQSTDTADQSAAAANGEVWKCTQTLNTPTGYQGGEIRLELIQDVNGETKSSKVVDGEKITFPYTLDITGAPGVSEGTLYVSEVIDGQYQQLGQYPITFQKVE
ncbi:Stk1 family PASTA domain-containing Ser/Thr kinase [Blautia sp. MSJ-19]|uniref:Stk1 family PASTA domain-containing Ser/Thr kinase n=1 Tax=Blautia sp. MSJ-19 TaxID=2841517 RepID=UPI001C0EB645|nr:Stk1 family PASTA domain-containing Ser/Thr kinase [Blautia sp. MSJ-19]MBU5480410.1 Stk1 family PASTA domain-containing Ser/Thr kinase [Blautia sp. MSJ-19]